MAIRGPSTSSVLLVTDMPHEREIYASRLRTNGYRVFNAETSGTAYEVAIATPFDVVVTDVWIAGSIGGLELIRRLRQDPRTAAVLIIVMTSVSRQQDREVALKAGANKVLQKPVPVRVLTEEIVRLLIPYNPQSPDPLPFGSHERDPRVCPQCVGILTYRHRWPMLTATLPAPGPREGRERLRYGSGWFCTNPACDYLELANAPARRR